MVRMTFHDVRILMHTMDWLFKPDSHVMFIEHCSIFHQITTQLFFEV